MTAGARMSDQVTPSPQYPANPNDDLAGSQEYAAAAPSADSLPLPAVAAACKHGIRYPHPCNACEAEPSDAEIQRWMREQGFDA
jgi:hypothetical protein